MNIKETLELIDGAIALLEEVKKLVADGVQFNDLQQLAEDYQNDPVLKAKLEAAADNINAVSDELAHLDIFEMLALGKKLLELPKLFKKKA